MKSKKILSAVLAGAMSLSMVNGVFAVTEERVILLNLTAALIKMRAVGTEFTEAKQVGVRLMTTQVMAVVH